MNTFWSKSKEFEYDGTPTNAVGGLYFINQRLFELECLPQLTLGQYNAWSNWIQKIQPDYRFLCISEQNCETIIFPEVDDPWMFTEYVYKAIGKSREIYVDDLGEPTETYSLKSADYVVVEPELYDYSNLNQINHVYFKQVNDTGWYYNPESATNKNYDVNKDENYEKDRYSTGIDGCKLYKVDIPVESVKWGEHGNIPENVVNMTAPKSWLDSGEYNVKIVPRYRAIVGTPVYTSLVGQFYYLDSKELYVVETSYNGPNGSGPDSYWTYDLVQSGGQKVELPNVANLSLSAASDMTVKFTPSREIGDILHTGCQSFVGKGGTIKCNLANTLSGDNKNKLKPSLSCMSSNTSCPYFIKGKDKNEVCSYESKVNNYGQMMQAIRGDDRSFVGIPFVGLWPTGSNSSPNPQNSIISGGLPSTNIRYEVTYEYVSTPPNPKVLVKNNNAQFMQGAYYVRGTGQYALDTQENAGSEFRDVDPIYFGDINQLSFHRFFSNCAHCYNSQYCNSTVGPSLKSGYEYGKRANVDGEPFCKYYRDNQEYGVGCPSDIIDKRAFEYQNMMIESWIACYQLASEFLLYVNNDDLNDYHLYRFIKKDIQFDGNGDPVPPSEGGEDSGEGSDEPEDSSDVYLVYDIFSNKDESERMGGIYCKMGDGDSSPKVFNGVNYYFVCRLVLEKDLSTTEITRYKLKDIYAWYQQYDFEGSPINKNGKPWFIKLDRNFKKANRWASYITNEDKFIGGYHPEYKDRSVFIEEFIYQVEDTDWFRDGVGDTGIGDPEYDVVKNPSNTTGVWINGSGNWIVDGRSLGTEYIGEDGSQEPRRGNGTKNGDAIPLVGRWTNTSINGSTGERKDPECEYAQVFSTDTKASIAAYRENP